ncbi:MAG: hypothetical protein JWP04_936 [Belnapia sp.]|nr:hypothetical protein [Belnapia sp.]
MPEDLLQSAALPSLGSVPRPAEVPEKFWDAEAGTLRTEALLKSYRELERRLSQRAAPPAADAAPDEMLRFRQAMGIPEAPDGYSIASPHALCCADPEVNSQLHAAHFSNDQAQLVYELAAQRLLPLIAEAAAEFEADRQREKLAAHFGGDDRFKAMAAQISAWGRAKLPEPVYGALCSTAEGVLALERMMRTEEPGLARDGVTPPQESEAELRAMMRDPRYWRTREPDFVGRVTEGFRRMVGG